MSLWMTWLECRNSKACRHYWSGWAKRERKNLWRLTENQLIQPLYFVTKKVRSQWMKELVPNLWRRQVYYLVFYLLAKHSSNLVLLYAFLKKYLIIIHLTVVFLQEFLHCILELFALFYFVLPNIRSLTKKLRPKQNYRGKMKWFYKDKTGGKGQKKSHIWDTWKWY